MHSISAQDGNSAPPVTEDLQARIATLWMHFAVRMRTLPEEAFRPGRVETLEMVYEELARLNELVDLVTAEDVVTRVRDHILAHLGASKGVRIVDPAPVVDSLRETAQRQFTRMERVISVLGTLEADALLAA